MEKEANVFVKLSSMLHLARNNPLYQYVLGAGQLASGFAERDPRVLGDKMTISQQDALAAKAARSSLGHVRWSIASRLGEESLIFCGAVVRPGWKAVSSAGLPTTREVSVLEQLLKTDV